ncbi:MAG: hypothetical protein JHC31_11865 [Sulfurihydrogenibium sp.]|jgi:NifU-like protein involved in Fe-S cluster formation|nr:hypothetical protein [Sulfurihydrogenibium sp.]
MEEKKLSTKEIQQILDEKEKIIIESRRSSLAISKIGENLWKLETYSKNLTSQILTRQSLIKKITNFINKNKQIEIKY